MSEVISKKGVLFPQGILYNYNNNSAASRPYSYPRFNNTNASAVLSDSGTGVLFYLRSDGDGHYKLISNATSGIPANRYYSVYHDLYPDLPSTTSDPFLIYFDVSYLEDGSCGSITACNSLKIFTYNPEPQFTTDLSIFTSYSDVYGGTDTSTSRNFFTLIPEFSYETSDSGGGSTTDPDPSVPSTFDDSGIVSAILMIPAAIIVIAFFSMITKIFLNRRIIS